MRRLITALLASLALLTACAAPAPEAWVPADVPTVSTPRLWEVTRMAMEREGFPITRVGFEPTSRTAFSGWKMDLHPFRGNGYRERAEVRYEAGRKPGMMVLSVRVAHQNNMNIAKPLDPSYAEWETGPDNQERARVIQQYIRSMLGNSLDIGKKIEEKGPGEKEYGSWEEQ